METLSASSTDQMQLLLSPAGADSPNLVTGIDSAAGYFEQLQEYINRSKFIPFLDAAASKIFESYVEYHSQRLELPDANEFAVWFAQTYTNDKLSRVIEAMKKRVPFAQEQSLDGDINHEVALIRLIALQKYINHINE